MTTESTNYNLYLLQIDVNLKKVRHTGAIIVYYNQGGVRNINHIREEDVNLTPRST